MEPILNYLFERIILVSIRYAISQISQMWHNRLDKTPFLGKMILSEDDTTSILNWGYVSVNKIWQLHKLKVVAILTFMFISHVWSWRFTLHLIVVPKAVFFSIPTWTMKWIPSVSSTLTHIRDDGLYAYNYKRNGNRGQCYKTFKNHFTITQKASKQFLIIYFFLFFYFDFFFFFFFFL